MFCSTVAALTSSGFASVTEIYSSAGSNKIKEIRCDLLIRNVGSLTVEGNASESNIYDSVAGGSIGTVASADENEGGT